MKKLKGFALLTLATGLIIPLTIVNRNNVREQYGDTYGYFRDTARNIDIWAKINENQALSKGNTC